MRLGHFLSICAAGLSLTLGPVLRAQPTTAPATQPAPVPPPSLVDVAYGTDARQRMDLWLAPARGRPTPVLIYAHGGGFRMGDKASIRRASIIPALLDAGISFASVEYRLQPTPVGEAFRDGARAVQTLRARAAEWNFDPTRIGGWGSSAGAGVVLWLAFHDDLADARAADPVARQSSRLCCAAASEPQCSYDLTTWTRVFGERAVAMLPVAEIPALYGLATMDEVLGPRGTALRADVDLPALVSADDPPVFLASKTLAGPPLLGIQLLHHPQHAVVLKEACERAGVRVVADLPTLNVRPKAGDPKGIREFLIGELTGSARVSAPR